MEFEAQVKEVASQLEEAQLILDENQQKIADAVTRELEAERKIHYQIKMELAGMKAKNEAPKLKRTIEHLEKKVKELTPGKSKKQRR